VLAGGTVRLSATATTTTGRTLNYAWASPEGKIAGSGPEVRYDTTGLRPGNYNATVRVDDGAGGFADCTVTVTVQEPPRPNAPTASCSVDRGSVNPGEAVTFSVRGASRDNRQLRYAWSGAVSGTGTTARLDTTNLSPGTYTANARVTDDRGLTADCSASTTVVARPAAPVMSKLNECSFKAKIARVDNVCKAVLDDVALRLQSDSDATAVVVGSSDPAELPKRAPKTPTASLAAQRASNVKLYLVTEKGIADSRIQVRAAEGAGSTVQMYHVPRGASFTGPGQIEKESPTATPYPHAPRPKAPAKKKAATTTDAAAAPAAKK
jgi:outer membrane protein OmpA-like peptidoglycan-associated protein